MGLTSYFSFKIIIIIRKMEFEVSYNWGVSWLFIIFTMKQSFQKEREWHKGKSYSKLKSHSFIRRAFKYNTNSCSSFNNLNPIIRNGTKGRISIDHFPSSSPKRHSALFFFCCNSLSRFLNMGLVKQSTIVFLCSCFAKDPMNHSTFMSILTVPATMSVTLETIWDETSKILKFPSF